MECAEVGRALSMFGDSTVCMSVVSFCVVIFSSSNRRGICFNKRKLVQVEVC